VLRHLFTPALGIAVATAAALVAAQPAPSTTAIRAARLFGVDRVTGTMEAGKEADIVAVPGDVLQNITATSDLLSFLLVSAQRFSRFPLSSTARLSTAPAAGALEASNR
jgi:cytosine/adenosine deaminase-related metal-dependent hydrolase